MFGRRIGGKLRDTENAPLGECGGKGRVVLTWGVRYARIRASVMEFSSITGVGRAAIPSRGAVAQLGERLNGIQEVDGSIPFSSTNLINRLASRARVRSSSEEFTKEFKALPFATLDLALEV